MNALSGILLVLGLLALLMLGVRLAQARGNLDPEAARKTVHVGMGTMCLSFPWIFARPEPVWALAGLASLALAAVRLVPAWRARFGGVLGGVGRASLGELYFPFSVALVFSLAGDDGALFCAAVAILTYADAAGALVGRRWGRTRYPAVESTKSVEGSAAVLLVAWACVTIILASLADIGWGRAVLMGGIVGMFASLVEAVSWRGLDNLLVPVVALVQLRVYAGLPAADLVGRAGAMLLLAGFMLTWRRHLLDSSARLAAALAIYLFWALGDWRWLAAPLVLLASYGRLMPTIPGGPPRHNLAAVVCIASAGIAWAAAQAWTDDAAWLKLYTLGFATQQAIIAAVRFSQGRPRWRPWQWWSIATLQAAAAQYAGFILANGTAALTVAEVATAAVLLGGGLAVFMLWDRQLRLPDDLNARWWRQGLVAVFAPLAGLAGMRL